MKEIKCKDLGIIDCTYVARGESAGDVLEDIIPHLRDEHDLDIPPAKELLKYHQVGKPSLTIDPFDNDPSVDEGVRLLTRRLMGQLEQSEWLSRS